MKRLSTLIVTLILPLTGGAQGALLDDIADLEPPAPPELRRYSVEVIVFAYAEDVHVGTEVFEPELLPEPELLLDENGLPISELPDGEAETAAEEAAEADAEGPATFTFELMPEEDYALQDVLTRLEELDAYQPLMHFGWIQGMVPNAETEALPLETFAAPPKGLQGTLTLHLSRYLHLVVDLQLAADEDASIEPGNGPAEGMAGGRYGDSAGYTQTQPVPTFADRPMFGGTAEYPASDEPRYAPLMYRISEDRIVRNGELRYYDHPKFGVIARVARVEAEEDADRPGESEDPAVPASAVAE